MSVKNHILNSTAKISYSEPTLLNSKKNTENKCWQSGDTVNLRIVAV